MDFSQRTTFKVDCPFCKRVRVIQVVLSLGQQVKTKCPECGEIVTVRWVWGDERSEEGVK